MKLKPLNVVVTYTKCLCVRRTVAKECGCIRMARNTVRVTGVSSCSSLGGQRGGHICIRGGQVFRSIYRVQLKKHPLQKSHYFQNNLIFFGEIFRGYS